MLLFSARKSLQGLSRASRLRQLPVGWRYLDLWLSANLLRHRTRLPKLRDLQSLFADKRPTKAIKDMGILLSSNNIKNLPVLSFRTVLWIWMSCWPPTHRLRKGCMLRRP